jgi:hypothetical protein
LTSNSARAEENLSRFEPWMIFDGVASWTSPRVQ